MGYNSYITSVQELTFSRPLNARETRDARTVIESTSYLSYFFNLDEMHETVETDEGTLTKTTASSLTTTGNEGKAYDAESELRDFILLLPKGVTVSGVIERIGEEWPDAERWYVDGRTVTSVRPTVIWNAPDGSFESVKAYDA